jgi:hypothetical protein
MAVAEFGGACAADPHLVAAVGEHKRERALRPIENPYVASLPDFAVALHFAISPGRRRKEAMASSDIYPLHIILLHYHSERKKERRKER